MAPMSVNPPGTWAKPGPEKSMTPARNAPQKNFPKCRQSTSTSVVRMTSLSILEFATIRRLRDNNL